MEVSMEIMQIAWWWMHKIAHPSSMLISLVHIIINVDITGLNIELDGWHVIRLTCQRYFSHDSWPGWQPSCGGGFAHFCHQVRRKWHIYSFADFEQVEEVPAPNPHWPGCVVSGFLEQCQLSFHDVVLRRQLFFFYLKCTNPYDNLQTWKIKKGLKDAACREKHYHPFPNRP